MFEAIVVPLDGSEFSEQTLPLARRLAEALEATLHLVHVHVPRPPDHFLTEAHLGVEGIDIPAWEDERRAQSQTYLEEIATRLRDEGTDVESVWLEGPFVDEMERYCAALESPLVLITSHGRTGVSRMWLGSSADAVIRTLAAPVLMLRPASGGEKVAVPQLKHILVPLDGSPDTAAILAPVGGLARAVGARLTLFHVVSSDDLIGGPILPVLIDSLPNSLEKAHQHLERRADILRAAGLDVSVEVVHSQLPGQAIGAAAEANSVDLIAMATHGYGGVRRILLGSVTDKVLRASGLPLLLQRPKE